MEEEGDRTLRRREREITGACQRNAVGCEVRMPKAYQ